MLSGRARPRSPSPVTAVPRARGKPRAGKAQPSPGPDLTRGRRAHRAAPQAAPSPGGAVSGPVPAAPASSRTCRGARRPAAGAAGQPVQTISQLSGLEARAAGGDTSSAAVRPKDAASGPLRPARLTASAPLRPGAGHGASPGTPSSTAPTGQPTAGGRTPWSGSMSEQRGCLSFPAGPAPERKPRDLDGDRPFDAAGEASVR